MEPLSIGNLNDFINEFISSRKGPETQADATALINVLLKAHNEGEGWIRTNELQQKLLDTKIFKSQKTLFRFLDELRVLNIIEKDERIELTPRSHSDKTKKNTYYRLKLIHRVPLQIQSHEMDRTARLHAELSIAKDLLVERGVEDPDAAIKKMFDERYGLKFAPAGDMFHKLGSTLVPNERGMKPLERGMKPLERGMKPVGRSRVFHAACEPRAIAKQDVRLLEPDERGRKQKKFVKKV